MTASQLCLFWRKHDAELVRRRDGSVALVLEDSRRLRWLASCKPLVWDDGVEMARMVVLVRGSQMEGRGGGYESRKED